MKQITYSQPDQSPLFRPILRFSIPLMLTGLLQLAYNTADSVVVGRYAGSTSLAAVGATTSIIFLLVTLFNGVSIGTNYLTARYYGAGDQEAISQTVHCARPSRTAAATPSTPSSAPRPLPDAGVTRRIWWAPVSFWPATHPTL